MLLQRFFLMLLIMHTWVGIKSGKICSIKIGLLGYYEAASACTLMMAIGRGPSGEYLA